MPLTWTIDPDQRLVTAVAEGEVTRACFEAYLDAIDQADALGYRKLFDGTRGAISMEREDVLALGVRMRTSHATGPMGARGSLVDLLSGQAPRRSALATRWGNECGAKHKRVLDQLGWF